MERRYQANLKLFAARGSKPLADWHVSNSDAVRHCAAPGDSFDGFVYELVDASPMTRLALPRPGAAALNLRHRRVVFELYADPAKSFGIELILRESGGGSRTLTLSRDCLVPEMTHGSPKAKLPLVVANAWGLAQAPALDPGWRLVDLDLKTLTPMAFNGALYSRLDGVALFGTCLLRSVEVRTESPPAFTAKRSIPLQPCFTVVGGVRTSTSAAVLADDLNGAEEHAGDDVYEADPSTFMTREEREAVVAAEELKAFEARKAAARESYLASLKEPLYPAAESEPLGLIPSGDPTPPTKRSQLRLQSAVRKLGAIQLIASAPMHPRRATDPRSHRTDGSLDVDASIYRREQRAGGGVVTDDTVKARRAVSSAQALCRDLRRGVAGADVCLNDLPVGEGGIKLISFTLAGERAVGLKSLSLAGSLVGDRGAEHLARSLRRNYTLTRLDLCRCGVGAPGAEAIAGAVTVGCPALCALLLSRNELGPVGAATLLDAAVQHKSLTVLALESTSCALGMEPLFQDGDTVRLELGRVVHQRTGRSVPADALLDRVEALDGRHTTLRGLRVGERGRKLDMRTMGRPPLAATFVNVMNNLCVQKLCTTMRAPIPALRVLLLGGNPFGAAAREELRHTLAHGPNSGSLCVKLKIEEDLPQLLDAETSKTLGASTTGPDGDAGEQTDAPDRVAMLLSRKGRPGTWAPEPSMGSILSSPSAAALDDHDDDGTENGEGSDADGELDPRLKALDSCVPLALPLSLTLSASQSAFKALSGARVTAHMPPEV